MAEGPQRPARCEAQAYALVVVTFGISIYAVDVTHRRVMLAVLGVALLVFLVCLRTAPPPPRP